MADFNLSSALSGVTAQAQRVAANVSFNVIQNTFINRLNDKVADIQTEASKNNKKIAELVEQVNDLGKLRPKATKFLFDNQTNFGKLEIMSENLTTMRAALNADSDEDNVSADELADFEEAKETFMAQAREMYQLTFPGIEDGDIITKIHDKIDELEALTAVEGVMDDEDAETYTNENREIQDILDDFVTQVSTALEVTDNTIESAKNLIENIDKELALAQANYTELNTITAAEKLDEINKLKEETQWLLVAISLSFEQSIDQADKFRANMEGQKPAPGSVLNMFI